MIYFLFSDVEYLLGRPLQRELAAEAQIEVALDSLLHISSSGYFLYEQSTWLCSVKLNHFCLKIFIRI